MYEEIDRDNSKEQASERLATAAFVLGIISLVSTLCCCPFIFSAIGIILALLSKGASETLKPRAKTGLILSIVGMVVSVVIVVSTIAFPIFMFKTNPEYKKIVIDEYEESLEQNEQMLREAYGDETYEQMLDMIEGLENF